MVVLVARWWWDAQTYIHIYSPCHVMMMIVKAKIDCIDGWLNECCIKKRVVFCCFSHGQYLIQSLLHVIVLQQPQKKRKKLFHFPSWSSFFLFFLPEYISWARRRNQLKPHLLFSFTMLLTFSFPHPILLFPLTCVNIYSCDFASRRIHFLKKAEGVSIYC